MTRRAWTMLAVGVAIAVALAGIFSRAGRPASTFTYKPSWGVFTPAQWQTVSARIERRGFDAASVRVVATTEIASRRPFALVAARSRTGVTCVVPVKGTEVGAMICRPAKPLTLFTEPETWPQAAVQGTPAHIAHATAVLGIVRDDVNGVAALDHRGFLQGLPLVTAGHMGVFGGGYLELTSLRAYDTRNRLLERLVLAKR